MTFVIAFSARNPISIPQASHGVIIGAVLVVFFLAAEFTEPVWVIVLVHMFFLFAASLLCNMLLFASTPKTANLAAFYLAIVLGGLLGSVFNTLLAPIIFNKIIEYPLVVILSVAIIPTVYTTSDLPKTDGFFDLLKQFVRKDLMLPVGLLFLTMLIGFALSWVSDAVAKVQVFFTILIPLLLSIRILKFKPIRFALCLAAVAIGSSFLAASQEKVLLEERNFFGAVRITDDPEQKIRTFYNGTTIHGRQSLSPKKRCEPISYYYRSGPLGQVMELVNAKLKPKNVAVIGLGVGTVTTYKKPNQNWKLYDINPKVIRIARDPRYFSLLSKCNDFEEEDFVLGDGRKMLEKEVDGKFDAIVIDAFNSDSIPVHLIT